MKARASVGTRCGRAKGGGQAQRSTARAILTSFFLGKSVQGVITFTKLSDEAGERKDGGLSRNHAAIGVNVGNSDLNGSMVLGLDDSASGSTLSGHVKVNKVSL